MTKVNLRRIVGRTAILAIMLVGAIATQTAAAGEFQPQDGPTLLEGNPKCTDIGHEYGFKPNFGATGETPPLGGPVTLSDGQLDVTIGVTGTNGDGEAVEISWSSNLDVDKVIVKGGNNGFVYVYIPAAMSGSGLTTPTNNGGNRPEISHIEFCYETEGGELEIEKTAETSSYLEYDWSIEKTVDHERLAITKDPTATATYTITATRHDGTAFGWTVWGSIGVTNSTDSIAYITDVTDDLSDHGEIDVECDAPEFPLWLEAGDTLDCWYGPVWLSDGSDRINTATVVTSDDGKVTGASDTVPVVFGDPTVLNDYVTVVDDNSTPGYAGDDLWWEFDATGSVNYQTSFWCKDAGERTNTAWLFSGEEFDGEQQVEGFDAVDLRPKSAQATVLIHCDTKTTKGESPKDGAAAPSDGETVLGVGGTAAPAAAATDVSCLGADAVRGSRGDSAWGLIGPKGQKTGFYLSNRSYWKVLKLGKTAKNPYFKLGAAYVMVKLHRLNGTPATPAVERAMNWTRRYTETHRPAFSNLKPNLSPEQAATVRKVRRTLRKHTRTLKRYADTMDAARCSS